MVPATETALFPIVVKVHVRLTVADVIVEVRVTLGALRLHAVPPFCDSPTIPTNPLTAVTRIVETPEDPTLTISPSGLAAIVKSWTLIVNSAE